MQMRYFSTLLALGRVMVLALAGLTLAPVVVWASDCEAVTTVNANLRPTMGTSTPIAVVPKGARVGLDTCFDQGAFCAVKWQDKTGFISGDLLGLTIDGQTVTARAAEQTRWSWLNEPDRGQSHMIVAWGDSLTAGAGADGEHYPRQAARLFGCQRDVSNQGVGGQSSTAIAARMNAVPTLLTLLGNQIPATGAVTVTQRTTTPVTNQGPFPLDGSLCGVAGQLAASTSDAGATYSYQFVRSGEGAPKSCPAGSRFFPNAGLALRDRIAWLWLGRNGAAADHNIFDDIAAAVASLGHQRFLVGSVLPSANDSADAVDRWIALNARLGATYGDHFVDIVGALQAAGDGSADDTADLAKHIIPRSLRSDAIHLNARGYAIVARVFHDATVAQGW